MDIDPNDLLTTNVYISKPELRPNLSINEEFKKYYEKEVQRQNEEKIISGIKQIELKNISHFEENDDNNIMNTNSFKKTSTDNIDSNISRFTKETKTLVSIDSRDRQKTLYPKPNNFKIFLGKTFSNVKKIEMVSLEFPNTDAVINTGNNKIYWRNLEDITDDVTMVNKGVTEYPVYSVTLRTGSYTTATLQTEITNKMNSVRRKQGISNGMLIGNGDYHYFVVNLDIDTDVTTFTSLNLQQCPNNPFNTSLGSGVISVLLPNHGFSTYDNVYITGVKVTAGISATTLTGFHQITVIDSNTFSIEVNIKAADTITGGGNTVKVGKKAPFQFLWGENSLIVAQNIGYPLENSSELIKTYISDLENLYQMNINFELLHNFSRDYNYIGQTVQVGYILSNTFIQMKTFTIFDITSLSSILVQVTDQTVYSTLNNNINTHNALSFNGTIYSISSYSDYITSSILISTQTTHNLAIKDIGSTITLRDTADSTVVNDVSYDGDYMILSVPNSTSLVIPGVLGGLNSHSSGHYGSISRATPLTTWTITIADIIKNYIIIGGVTQTKIITSVPHNLNIGETVMINNVISTPLLSLPYTITSILDATSFLIPVYLESLDSSTFNSQTSFVGTGLITVSFPGHNFNKIVGMANGTSYTQASGAITYTVQPILVSTFNSHNLNIGDKIRLTGTNTTPNMDGGGYVVHTVDSNDTFSIIKSANPSVSFQLLTNIPSSLTGIIGLTHDFYLYDVEDIGGISKTLLNGIKFTIRDIIDENTFTFMMSNAHAKATETGGGSNVYISSLYHGFNGVQTNTKNNILTRSINLQGEDYCFLTCPQLDTMLNTGNVQHIFARISLDQPPGYVCFKFLSNPKHFNIIPLDKLSELEFSIVNYNNSLYDFNDLDFSFTLEIIEVTDATKSFNISSRRGITDTS